MATYNGTLNETTRSITHNGDILWNTGSLTWATYDSWAKHTSSADFTGAVGTPLKYQTEIIDLGSSQTVYPSISYGGTDDVRVVIEYHTSNSDLSGASFLGKYLTDNSDITSNPITHCLLDYTEAGYCNEDSATNTDYNSFTARYVRFTIYVESFATNTTRNIQTLESFSYQLLKDKTTQTLEDVDTSGLSGSADARVLNLTDVGSPTTLVITAHSESGKVLIPQIVSKANKTIRVIDSAAGTSSVDATIDVYAEGFPGSLTATKEGIGIVAD